MKDNDFMECLSPRIEAMQMAYGAGYEAGFIEGKLFAYREIRKELNNEEEKELDKIIDGNMQAEREMKGDQE